MVFLLLPAAPLELFLPLDPKLETDLESRYKELLSGGLIDVMGLDDLLVDDEYTCSLLSPPPGMSSFLPIRFNN